MFSTKNLAQNEFIELAGSRIRSLVASIASIAATSATAVFVIKIPVTPNPIAGVTQATEWIAVGLVNGITQATESNLTGASQYAWANVPGAERVRVYRTDATGGNGTVGFSLVEG